MQPKLCTRILAPVALALVAGVGGGAVTAAEPEAAAILPLAEVEPGLVGEGWSVFSGREPERFEVEVLGVWQMVAPDSSYILTRLKGKGLEHSGVIAGMSGSPVYVDDRLLGAVAFSWAFASDAIAGVTPIESMRRLTSAEAAIAVSPAGAMAPDLRALVEPGDAREQLIRELARLGGEREERSSLLWSSTGLGAQTQSLLRQAVGPIVPAGSAEGLADELEPGDAVAAVLIDGDFRLAATGTVTDRVGSTVLAFGHPFLSLGDVVVPMAAAEILTVVPSLANSFKVGNIGPTIGAFDRDRPAGVRGTLGVAPPMLPLRVAVRGETERDFDMRLARIGPVTGVLVATAILGAVDAANGAGGHQELDLAATIELAGHPPITLAQRFHGVSAGAGAALHLLNVVGFLSNNALARVEIDSIAVSITQRRERREARILAAHPDRRVVTAGTTVGLSVEIDPFQGEPWRHRMEIDLPRDLEAGPYILLVGDGTSLDAARLELEKFQPVRLTQALEFLDGLHSRSDLGVLGVVPSAGLAVGGETLPRLPGSIRQIWQASSPTGVTELRTAVRQEVMEPLDRPLTGLVRIDLEIEAREKR